MERNIPLIFVFVLILLTLLSATTTNSTVIEKHFRLPGLQTDSGISVEELGNHAGFYSIQHSHAASSELAAFYENGPFTIANNMSLAWNDHGWDKASNLIYVDQPTGTGFSYSPDKRDIRQNEEGVSNDLYDFLQACMTGDDDVCLEGRDICLSVFNRILMSIAGNINIIRLCIHLQYYDIRKECEGDSCYDFSNMVKFLNRKPVKDALGVGNAYFFLQNLTVYDAMKMDWVKNLEVDIPALLKDGIRSLIYAGEYDLICNWLGNSRWVHPMEWYGQKDFVGKPVVPFVVDGVQAGEFKSHGPLSFLKAVYDAGDMVPMDQPKAALEMLRRWTRHKLG
ncbi:hypothetical protein AQUCO_10200044v1 [Aquilegia coerulea]|uniref:Uncharacterized protein n=1 Tax=Aquilegia coerulea TaxID=218851 RepID=A0A2G5C409_AQUCA|nr:hypothetical protein AQUCO_10200044v1 [Aquilegia coerulea]